MPLQKQIPVEATRDEWINLRNIIYEVLHPSTTPLKEVELKTAREFVDAIDQLLGVR